MYNKKYRLEKIEQFNRPNHIYLEMEGRLGYLVYFNVGERGWFLYETGDAFDDIPHRVHTTIVKDVKYTRGNQVIVTTQNTRYTFVVISE